jgi:hypothetical protein
MQQFFNQLLQFLQQGIAAIFKFVQLIWTWSVGHISALTQVPWQSSSLAIFALVETGPSCRCHRGCCLGTLQGRKGTLGCR